MSVSIFMLVYTAVVLNRVLFLGLQLMIIFITD